MTSERWPLFERYPALADLPRVNLRPGSTPIQSLEWLGRQLWIKRDDQTAHSMGGNKVRSLEFLLGGLSAGDRIATVGPCGSTHALATAVHARALGCDVFVGLWRQEMNPVASIVADELRRVTRRTTELGNPAVAIPWLWWRRARGDRTIPAGGTSPLGMLGHVNAGLELARQIEMGEMPEPKTIVIPLGTGGTIAGIGLGLAIAGIRPLIVAARVVPWILGRRGRIDRLTRSVERLIRGYVGTKMPQVELPRIRISATVYGGAYGRELEGAAIAGKRLNDATGIQLDATYAGKAFVAAMEEPRESGTLFWLTFDGRWMNGR